MAAIEVSSLTKHYGDVVANDDLTFSAESGEIFGYLGPNGAGKTTTIRTLLGLLHPTDGTACVLGTDIRDRADHVRTRKRIGYLPGDPAFDESSTGAQLLDLHESIKGGERREELLEHFEPPVDRPVRTYSRGNVQKLGLVQAFMHDPDLVILDEPTSGLDPLLQEEFNEFIRAERDRGTTVFMSSHILSEVRRVCDRVGIIRGGQLVAVEAVADLLGRSGKVVRARIAESISERSIALPGVTDLALRTVGDGETELTFTFTGDVNELVAFLEPRPILELEIEEAPLEDVFMSFYGERSTTTAPGGDSATDNDGGQFDWGSQPADSADEGGETDDA